MKRSGIFLLTFFLLAALTACGSQDKQGTYYPNAAEMRKNLESAGYTVQTEELDSDNPGTHLCAENGEDYMEFYWLEQLADVGKISAELEKRHPDYNKLVSAEQDEKFGSFVFCGTNAAIDAAGIRIVQMKV